MHSAHARFLQGIASSTNLSGLYTYLSNNIAGPFQFEDILRFQIVYAVSALDTLLHDLIRIGMLQIFSGTRTPTAKYLAETVQLAVYQSMHDATVNLSQPPREHYFEQEIIRRHKFQSFQEPTKIADGLGLIWDHPQKWQAISSQIGQSDNITKSTLTSIVGRRNRIVHEADLDPFTRLKTPITQGESNSVSAFIQTCGSAIYTLVV